MAFFTPTVSTVNGQTSTVSMPPWMEELYRTNLNRGVELSNQAYTPYDQPRQAELTPDQIQAFDLARQNVGIANPYLDRADTLTRQALQAPTQAGIAQYMNPYDELVTQQVIRELGRQNEMGMNTDAARAVQAGAFGGSRFGVVEAERNRNYMQQIQDYQNQAAQASYAQGLGQYNLQQQIGLAGAQQEMGMGQTRQALSAADVAALLGTGSLQQAQSQTGLDLAYQDFSRQLAYPYEQVSYVQDLLSGTPSSQQSSTQQQQIPGPSVGQQLGGLGIGALGILGQSGAFKTGGWGSDLISGIGSGISSIFSSGGGGIADAGFGAIADWTGGGLFPW